MQIFFIYWEVTKAWKVWLLLMRSVPKSAAIFLRQWLRRLRHAETDKKKKRRKTKAIRPCEQSWNWEPFLAIGWVPERAKTQKRESFSWRCSPKNREKHSESVREWKKKKETFFFIQVTRKEHKLVEFSWSFWMLQPWRVGIFRGRFYYWICGEIVFTHWDLFVVYPIYCEHKFNINLIIVISIS